MEKGLMRKNVPMYLNDFTRDKRELLGSGFRSYVPVWIIWEAGWRLKTWNRPFMGPFTTCISLFPRNCLKNVRSSHISAT